jgi:hypothetical protein
MLQLYKTDGLPAVAIVSTDGRKTPSVQDVARVRRASDLAARH